jgi:hypothetical protein
LAGLTIDLFPNLPSATITDTDWVVVGRGDTTYHLLYPELVRYAQKRSDLLPNNPLGPQLYIVNGGFVATVSGGALTVSMKTANGDDPSTSDPVFIVFRHPTMTNGTYAVRKIIGPVTFTVSSGNTLGVATSAPATELLIVVINDTTLQVGLVNPKFANGTYYVPDEWNLKSTTGGTGGTNAGVIYSPTSAVSKSIAVVGFIRWNAGLTSPGTWTAPDSVQAVNAGTNVARLNEHINDVVSKFATVAPLASPALTGTPVAPTAVANTSTTQLATTAFVVGQAATATPLGDGIAAVGTSTRFAREDHIHPSDTTRAPINNPTFTGTPVAPTAIQDTNTTQIATTGFYIAQASAVVPIMDGVGTIGSSYRFARSDHVHPSDTTRAPIGSPTFTGIPAGPTAALDTNTTQFATTAFVLSQTSATTPAMDGTGATGTSNRYARADHIHPTNTNNFSATSPVMDGAASPGAATTYARSDHTHPTDTSKAGLSSPSFTGTATFTNASSFPAAVRSGALVSSALLSIGRTGHESGLGIAGNSAAYFANATAGDCILRQDITTGKILIGVDNGAGTATPQISVSSAGAAFTGSATASTASVDTNTTQIATTAFVVGQGYLKSATAASTYLTPATASTTYAVIASPSLTGTPTAPTAVQDTNSGQIATTGYVVGQASASIPNMDGTGAVGTSLRYARADHIHPTDSSRAPLASPTFTGTPAAPTPAANTNTTQIATCAFVISQVSSAGNYSPGAVAITGGTINNTTIGATTASTGVFTTIARTSALLADDNTTQLSSTAWYFGQKGTATPNMDGTGAAGTSARWSPIDHTHPTDTSRAPLASPALTGTPTAPTAAVDTNTTQLATTAYVISQAYLKSATAASTYLTQTNASSTYSPLASPNFSGTPAVSGSTIWHAGNLPSPSRTVSSSDVSAGSSSADLTIPTGYRSFDLHIGNLVPGTDAVALCIRFSFDGGGSYIATTSYFWQTLFLAGTGTPAGTQSLSQAQFALNVASGSSFPTNFTYSFHPGASGQPVSCRWHGLSSSGAAGASQVHLGGGFMNVSTARATNVRLFFNTGTISRGTLSLVGIV